MHLHKNPILEMPAKKKPSAYSDLAHKIKTKAICAIHIAVVCGGLTKPFYFGILYGHDLYEIVRFTICGRHFD